MQSTLDKAAYSEELSDGTTVKFFEKEQVVEIRQGPGQSVQLHYEDVNYLIDALIVIRDEEF